MESQLAEAHVPKRLTVHCNLGAVFGINITKPGSANIPVPHKGKGKGKKKATHGSEDKEFDPEYDKAGVEENGELVEESNNNNDNEDTSGETSAQHLQQQTIRKEAMRIRAESLKMEVEELAAHLGSSPCVAHLGVGDVSVTCGDFTLCPFYTLYCSYSTNQRSLSLLTYPIGFYASTYSIYQLS
ncbi:hypothetical protein PAXINDRAFT_9315 [Paxillus involutus ATCC 200175]|nr:hypothetical protein PAXINDRAFT_9315 [Paxillus involutus ATCC 200175]